MGMFSAIYEWLMGSPEVAEDARDVDTTSELYLAALAALRDRGPVLLDRLELLEHAQKHDPAEAKAWLDADPLLAEMLAFVRLARWPVGRMGDV